MARPGERNTYLWVITPHNEQNERQPLNRSPGKLTDYTAIHIIYKTNMKR